MFHPNYFKKTNSIVKKGAINHQFSKAPEKIAKPLPYSSKPIFFLIRLELIANQGFVLNILNSENIANITKTSICLLHLGLSN